MKSVFGLLLLWGLASAAFFEELDSSQHEMEQLFVEGMDHVSSLKETVGDGYYSGQLDRIEGDIKSEIAKSFKDALSAILKNLSNKIIKGQEILQEIISKTHSIIKNLEFLKDDGTERFQEIIEKLRERAQEVIKDLFEKLGFKNENFQTELENAINEINLNSIVSEMKEKILEKVDLTAIVKYIKSMFGEISEVTKSIVEAINKNGLSGVKDLIGAIIGHFGDVSEYGIFDFWKKVKDFFGGLGSSLKTKFSAFAEWVKKTAAAGIENIKDKAAKLKALAQNVINNVTTMSKEAATQAWEYLKEHRYEIGEFVFNQLKTALFAYISTAVFG